MPTDAVTTLYCFLPNMLCTKSEVWAAWVQGIGSVLAILAAVGIATHQQRVKAREEREVDRRVARMATVFGIKLVEAIGEIAHACRSRNMNGVDRFRAVVADVAEWPASITIDRLPTDAILAFLALRSVAAQAADLTFDMNNAMTLTDTRATELADLLQRAHQQLILLRRGLGDFPAEEPATTTT